MALPPTVPTSFVPRPTTTTTRRSDFTGAFTFFGYGVLAVVVALAIGAFVYAQILTTERNNKDAELQKQIDSIDPQTVTKFTHLRDRLTYGLDLLNKHEAFSGFWDTFTSVMPATVRFSTMQISVDSSGIVTLQGAGKAKSFNALAATSDAFAKDGRIKDAIFSGIRVDGSAVSFSLAATIDPALVTFRPSADTVPESPADATDTSASDTSTTDTSVTDTSAADTGDTTDTTP